MSSKPSFVVYLKKASRSGIVWGGLFLHLFSVPFFVNELFQTGRLPLVCIGPILVALVIAILKIKYPSSTKMVFVLNYLLIAATWFAMPYFQFIGALFLVLAWFDWKQLQPQIIEIGESIQFKNNLTKKEILWNQLENLVLKHGLLTIDFKNNRLLQLETDLELSQINEVEFNQFCQQQLSK